MRWIKSKNRDFRLTKRKSSEVQTVESKRNCSKLMMMKESLKVNHRNQPYHLNHYTTEIVCGSSSLTRWLVGTASGASLETPLIRNLWSLIVNIEFEMAYWSAHGKSLSELLLSAFKNSSELAESSSREKKKKRDKNENWICEGLSSTEWRKDYDGNVNGKGISINSERRRKRSKLSMKVNFKNNVDDDDGGQWLVRGKRGKRVWLGGWREEL